MGGFGIKYRVVRKIAQGGMAEVFLGEAIHTIGPMRRVAIKRLLPHLAGEPEPFGMFQDEVRLMVLLHHPNIVRVYDCGVSGSGVPYVVMEYVEGADAGTVVARSRRSGRPVPLGDAVDIAVQVCAALSWAHELHDEGEPLGVIHRDITPPNILFGNRGEVKICDFGLAKSRTQRIVTEPGIIKGKFGYLSPEAACGEPVDVRSDLFSLAVIVWEMLATQRLFLGVNDYETVKLAQKAEVPSLSALNPAIDDVFEQVLMRALARDPERRYPSARAFMQSLLAYADFAELESDLPALVAQAMLPDTASGIREAVDPVVVTADADPYDLPDGEAFTAS
jgi:serine/threonine protein kinase